MRAKPLQTVSRFPRETPRRYAEPKSNAFTLRTYSTEIVFTLGMLYSCFLKKNEARKIQSLHSKSLMILIYWHMLI